MKAPSINLFIEMPSSPSLVHLLKILIMPQKRAKLHSRWLTSSKTSINILSSEGYGPWRLELVSIQEKWRLVISGHRKIWLYCHWRFSQPWFQNRGLTKHFNTNILVSEFTKKCLRSISILFRHYLRRPFKARQNGGHLWISRLPKTNREHHEPFISTWENVLSNSSSKTLKGLFIVWILLRKISKWCLCHDLYGKMQTYQSHPEEFNNSIVMENK